ncbi:hypothetical protein [Sorangium sp. So ce1078]|uniref:hypothetical protein n=1 Tax=Sorangium sp. So ce1078 TaxID=3133329 RepID=UPI003F61083B
MSARLLGRHGAVVAPRVRLVAFFATGDSIVANNLVLNLYKHINAYVPRGCHHGDTTAPLITPDLRSSSARAAGVPAAACRERADPADRPTASDDAPGMPGARADAPALA